MNLQEAHDVIQEHKNKDIRAMREILDEHGAVWILMVLAELCSTRTRGYVKASTVIERTANRVEHILDNIV